MCPNIAQLVERSTVEEADIEWSLVRFRVFGVFHFGAPHVMMDLELGIAGDVRVLDGAMKKARPLNKISHELNQQDGEPVSI